MARPPAGRHQADEPKSPSDAKAGPDAKARPDETNEMPRLADDRADDGPDFDDDDEAGGDTGRTAATDAFWAGVSVDPVEVALPRGVGYTLRAYRMDSEITPADVSGRQADIAMPGRHGSYDLGSDGDALLDEDALDDDAEPDDALIDDGDEEDGDSGDEVAALVAAEPEEVPLFLSQGGHLLLFRTPEGLVEFVRSDAEHDMTQLDTWAEVTAGIRAGHVVPLPGDAYELDLVVNNLRGGHDVWDSELIVQVGQFARDLSHALRIEPVVLALAPGSPLDDLDEALRAVSAGGFGAFRARRRAKKIGAETASLGWRSIIGKISSVVDWRD